MHWFKTSPAVIFIKRTLWHISGYLYAWLALGTILGNLANAIAVYGFDMPSSIGELEGVNRPPDAHTSSYCYPLHSYGFTSRCHNTWLDMFWDITTGIASACSLLIGMGGGFIRAGIVELDSGYIAEGLTMLLIISPLLLLIFCGICYWRKRSAYFCWIMSITYLLLILLLIWKI